jgi:hypothetical protein
MPDQRRAEPIPIRAIAATLTKGWCVMGTPKNSGPRSGRIPARLERNKDLVEKRMLGASWSQIAAHFEISETRARIIWDAAIKKGRFAHDQTIEVARTMEVEKLDKLAIIHWQRASDPQSAAILLRISERRSALLGLDSPLEARIEHLPPRQAPDHDLSRLTLEELRAFRDLVAKVESPGTSTNAPLLIEHQPADELEDKS